jgi:hypothetical protein
VSLGHLGVPASDYDRAIRAFIPNYERMIATVVHWLEGHVPRMDSSSISEREPEGYHSPSSRCCRMCASSSSTLIRTCSKSLQNGAPCTTAATS